MSRRAGNAEKDDRFAESFATESLLRVALLGLLRRIPDIHVPLNTHGPRELGKDLVFRARLGFEDGVYCACVVKNHRFTGRAGEETGIRTIVEQAEDALLNPYEDEAGGTFSIQRVYVISPFSLSEAAIVKIRSRLRGRAGQVQFWCGAHLFELFRRYWPEYLADESSAIDMHLRQTEKGALDGGAIRELSFQYQLGQVDYDIRRVYVMQGFLRILKTYSLTTLLASPPKLPASRETLDMKEVSTYKSSLSRVNSALQSMAEWELLDSNACSDLIVECERLSNTLSEDWQSTLGQAQASESMVASSSFSEVRFKPSQWEQLAGEARVIHDRIKQMGATLGKTLDDVRGFLQDPQMRDVRALESKQFVLAGHLEEGARESRATECLAEGAQTTLTFPDDLLDQFSGSLLVVGPAGLGKTSFCRYRALVDAERFSTDQSAILPYYVPLYRFSHNTLGTFEECFLGNIGRSALLMDGSASVTLRRAKRVRVYLDGLDEIPLAARQREIIELARNAVYRNRRLQVIVTARDYAYGPWLCWLPRVQLAHLRDSQIAELAAKWLDDEQERRLFFSQLEKLPRLRGIMAVPLFATLVILVFRQTQYLPAHKSALYDMFVDLMCGGWDVAKRVQRPSEFGSRVNLAVLVTLGTC